MLFYLYYLIFGFIFILTNFYFWLLLILLIISSFFWKKKTLLNFTIFLGIVNILILMFKTIFSVQIIEFISLTYIALCILSPLITIVISKFEDKKINYTYFKYYLIYVFILLIMFFEGVHYINIP